MQCPKIQVTLTPDMLQKLKIISAESGNSVSSIIRTLVADYLRNKSLEGGKNGTN